MSASTKLGWIAAALGLAAAALGAAGCNTEAYCFTDCPGDAVTTTGTNTGGGGAGGQECFPNCTTSSAGGGGGGGAGPCVETNGGIEICDHLDNDCNDAIDDIPGIDYTALTTCGTCDNNCLTILLNNENLMCDPGPSPGTAPGTCSGTCAAEFYDLDGNGSCEYYCPPHPNNPESICDNFDNDCDGLKDEDVNTCTSVTDCGACGNNCVVLHGTPDCVHTGPMPCTLQNTQCTIAACECPDAQGLCWHDIDGSYATGCEYQCQPSGAEVCGDGIDNDCDGLIDGADDLSGDPQIGVPCFGDPDGLCATPAHQGATICQGGQVVCGGAAILHENQQPELCNGQDDDCDGQADEGATDAGTSCGQSNIFPCSFGTYQCQNGALVCVGAVNPGVEVCNGVDDNCDGVTDFNVAANMPPADSVGPCNVPPPPPNGVPQPCQAGTKACVSGTVVCQGSVGPSSPTDACGVDSNCDGSLTGQPNLMTDVNHCGSCANNCYTGAVHSNWSCNNGMCQFQGCQPGYYDPNNDQQCEYACVFIQATETCNGVDDNCNGQIDEGVVTPSPSQVCGVSPSASSPECTSGVTVSCANGTWQCSFPPNVCNAPGGCAATPEVCDAIDNNCNGLINENTPNYNAPCNSDDGLPPPGHGACRTQGVYQCTGPSSVACSAMPASCASLPGGCTELCDGIDNDCDGLVDEAFNNKGSNAANFVRPVVTKIAASTWIYTYEASRPNATATTPGSGNGYQTSAPAGQTIDQTRACSASTKIPWFNVTGQEVEQTCIAMGGAVCSTPDWTTACQATVPCTWGLSPRNNNGGGTTCTTAATASKYCNLSLTYDFNPGQGGDQDGLLPTASPLLGSCWADWFNLQGNTAATDKIFDITGNLREVTKKANNQYALMGGAFNSQSQDGSTCAFSFYTVDQNFKFFDTGFRCCFSADPTM